MTIKNCIKHGAILLLLVHCSTLFAQDIASSDVSFSIPEVALIDIEPGINNTIYFEIDANIESGTSPVITNNINETLWLNYTSSRLKGSRSISANVSGGSVPDGISVYVRASKYSGSGNGDKFGNRTSRKELTATPTEVVKNIKNCYTGDGVGNGHLLTFTMEISDINEVKAINDASFIVTYTLTDN